MPFSTNNYHTHINTKALIWFFGFYTNNTHNACIAKGIQVHMVGRWEVRVEGCPSTRPFTSSYFKLSFKNHYGFPLLPLPTSNEASKTIMVSPFCLFLLQTKPQKPLWFSLIKSYLSSFVTIPFVKAMFT
jgi:hypothetical protein